MTAAKEKKSYFQSIGIKVEKSKFTITTRKKKLKILLPIKNNLQLLKTILQFGLVLIFVDQMLNKFSYLIRVWDCSVSHRFSFKHYLVCFYGSFMFNLSFNFLKVSLSCKFSLSYPVGHRIIVLIEVVA